MSVAGDGENIRFPIFGASEGWGTRRGLVIRFSSRSIVGFVDSPPYAGAKDGAPGTGDFASLINLIRWGCRCRDKSVLVIVMIVSLMVVIVIIMSVVVFYDRSIRRAVGLCCRRRWSSMGMTVSAGGTVVVQMRRF